MSLIISHLNNDRIEWYRNLENRKWLKQVQKVAKGKGHKIWLKHDFEEAKKGKGQEIWLKHDLEEAKKVKDRKY